MGDMTNHQQLNVLMLSLDSELLKADSASRARHFAFAEHVAHLSIIVRTVGGAATPIHAAPNLTIYPTSSAHKLTFILDALKIGKTLSNIDLIITQDMFFTGVVGVRLKKFLNAPLLIQDHSTVLDSPAWLAEKPLRNQLALRVARWVVRHADYLRTVNQHERAAALRLGMPPERVAVLPLATISPAFAAPVDDERLQAIRAQLGILDAEKLVLWFGYPAAVKRVPLLLEIFKRVLAQHPQTRLLLVADLTRSPVDLPQLARTLGIDARITFHDTIPHAQLPAYYQLAANGRGIYAMTSAYEGLGRVVSEAGACKIPVVAFDVIGVREGVQSGANGYLIPDGDLDQFAAQVINLLDNPAHAAQLGVNGREIALTEFSAETYPQRWVSLWHAAVKQGKR